MTATPPSDHQDSRGQLKERCVTATSLRPGVVGAKGRPPDPLLSLHYTRTQVALAQFPAPRSATGWQPMPIGYLSGPR
jgi:hypothetical protein